MLYALLAAEQNDDGAGVGSALMMVISLMILAWAFAGIFGRGKRK